jgi:hypothetical protein
MGLTIGQIATVSYPAVLADQRKPHNQWAESSYMAELERQGGIKKENFGSTIDAPLDYQRNPGTAIQVSDLAPLSTSKTEVMTSASYSPAEVVAPIVWSNLDEVQNPSEKQKVALVKSLIKNALDSHDDILEQYLFSTSTNGFLGLGTHMTTAGTGSDGGIDAGTYTFWANQKATYVDDTDIEAAMTTVWNACAKGSGAKLNPTLCVSDGPTQAIFEGTQQALQRYDSQDMKAAFKSLMFKTARYVFSQYGTSSIFFQNPKNLQLVVSKGYFRDLSETIPLPNATGFTKRVYSAVQFVTNNRSRGGVVHT